MFHGSLGNCAEGASSSRVDDDGKKWGDIIESTVLSKSYGREPGGIMDFKTGS